MHKALHKPAVRAELDGGYERFLASIRASGHRQKADRVASALAREREWGVPLRSRRILDVDNFLARNTPIPTFSKEDAVERGWRKSSASHIMHSRFGSEPPTARHRRFRDGVIAGGARAPLPYGPTIRVRRTASRRRTRSLRTRRHGNPPCFPLQRRAATLKAFFPATRRIPGASHTRCYALEVFKWAVPGEIRAETLAEAWQADVEARFPASPRTAASQQAAGFGNYVQLAVRQELHEGFQEIAIGLRNRVDPRPALAELCRRLVDRGAQRESAQARFIARVQPTTTTGC